MIHFIWYLKGNTIMETLNLTLRQRKLLHIIQEQTGFITGSQLAAELGVSPRTIRSDVTLINRQLAAHNARIFSERSKGYLFEAEEPEKIRMLNRIDTAFFTREERIRFLTCRLCLADEPLNLYDLEDEMFVSHTTLLYDLHALKLNYVLKEPGIRLIQSRNDIAFEKDERKIRQILLLLFHDGWDYNSQANAYYGYQFLDENILRLIQSEVPLLLREHHIRMEDPGVIALELSLAIMYHRCDTGHPLPPEDCAANGTSFAKCSSSETYRMTRELFRFLEEKLNCSFPPSESESIYRFISAASLPDASAVTRSTAPGYFSSDVLAIGTRYLQTIFDIFRLDFSADDDFYITLMFYIRTLKGGQTIFNKQGNINTAKEALSAELEIAWLFQGIAQEQFGHLLSETELIYLAHCISGALEFYFVTHPEKKLRTVLCCHRNMPSAWALKRKVLGAFSNYLDITDLIPVNTKSAFDFSHTDLILSTVNQSIDERQRAHTLPISYLLPPADLSAISDYIQHQTIRSLCPSPGMDLHRLFRSAFWHECSPLTERFPIIETLAEDFIQNSIATEKHLEHILKRESVSSFVTRPGIAFLHTTLPAKETKLAFMTLENRIVWNGHKIRAIVMAVFREEDLNLLFHLKYIFHCMKYDAELLKTKKTAKELSDFFLEFLGCLTS